MEEASQQDVKQQQQQQQGVTPRSAGTGSGGAGKRTLPPQQHLSPFSSPPAAHDAFLSKLEEAKIRDEVISQVLSGKSDASFLTPVRSTLRTPQPYQQTGGAPGAPSSNKGRAHSRTEQAREFLGNVASGARAAIFSAAKGPKDLVEGVRAGLERARAMSPLGKHSANKATRTPPPTVQQPPPPPPPQLGDEPVQPEDEEPLAPEQVSKPKKISPKAAKPNVAKKAVGGGKAKPANKGPAKKRSATGAAKQAAKQAGGAAAPKGKFGPGAGTKASSGKKKSGYTLAGKPPNAQTQLELERTLLGQKGLNDGNGAADGAAAGGKPGGGGKKRAGASDPLVRHGYITQGPIAAGAFSTIVRAKMVGSGLEVAVKSFDNAKCKKDYQHLYLREMELGALRAVRLHTPCRWVANLIEEHVGPNHTYAILEYCNGGSLQRHLQKLQTKGQRGNPMAMSEADVAHLGAQVNAALLHLHRLDVAHRDLKPGNVLFYGNDGNHLKLCDFGFAKRCRGQRLHTICGTPIYMAPELTQESKKGYVGQPVDMWAFGALLYEMLHNKIAFTGVSEQQLYQRIRGGNHAAFRKELSKETKTLIKGLLSPDPSARFTSEYTAKQPFFARVEALDSRRDELEI